jgi:hypothetical protein
MDPARKRSKELNRWKKTGEERSIIITAVDGGPWLLPNHLGWLR